MSAANPNGDRDFTGLLVLRGSRGESAGCSSRINHLPRLLVLRNPEQDSTELAEKIGPYDAERVLREIPWQTGEGRREHQRRADGPGGLRLYRAALEAMRDEVIGITSTPGGLRLCAPCNLTRRGRTGMLATTDAPSGTNHWRQMQQGRFVSIHRCSRQRREIRVGPLLASNPGSILASAEAITQTTRGLSRRLVGTTTSRRTARGS